MRKTTMAAMAAAALIVGAAVPATAARAPDWGNAPTFSADFYGSEPYSITGLYCQDGGDGNSTIDVSVYARGLYGTTDSYFFSGERTEGQYRTNDNRRTKEYTWRIYANDFDFSLWD